jgi:hypothetical protein
MPDEWAIPRLVVYLGIGLAFFIGLPGMCILLDLKSRKNVRQRPKQVKPSGFDVDLKDIDKRD